MFSDLYYMNLDELQALKESCLGKKQFLSRSLSKLLEDNERKMDYENTDTDVWKKYKTLYEEYTKINVRINRLDWEIDKNVR